LYAFQGRKILNYAEKAHEKSRNLENSILLLDVYIQMAMALMYQFRLEEPFAFLEKADNLLNVLTNTDTSPIELMERKAMISYVKAWLYYDQGDHEKALETAHRCLEIRQKLNLKVDIGLSLLQFGWLHFKSNSKLSLQFIERAINQGKLIKYKHLIQQSKMLKGIVNLMKGELEQALDCFKLSLIHYTDIPEDIKDNFGIAQLLHLTGTVYYEQDNLGQAKKNFEKALEIKTEYGSTVSRSVTLDELISLSIDQGDLESAEEYLKEMKILAQQEDIPYLNLGYRIEEARLLKLSPIASNRALAEEILKQSLKDKVADEELKKMILLNLTEILLTKLRETNNLKLINDIHGYVDQILKIAKNLESYSLLAETYLLLAKLDLLKLDLNGAQKHLDRALDIAEKHGLNQLNRRLIEEQDELFNEINNWERLRNIKSSIDDLINLVHVEEQLTRMIRKRFSY
ncbi:MAG: tetratricopeptide repeat protein, partial [Candidatus Hermodarchaeota archaeon]